MTSPDIISPSTENPGFGPENESQDFTARREERGLRLEDVFAQTRISVRNLHAIERGDFSALPPPVYTKAFITQYATFIGADPQPVMARYEAYLKAQEGPHTTRKNETQDGPPQKSGLRKPLWAVAGVFIAIVALALIFFAPYDSQRGDSPHEVISMTPGIQSLPATPPPTVPEPPPPESSTEASVAPAAPQPETSTVIPAPAAVPTPTPLATTQGPTASLPPPSPPVAKKPPLVTAAGSQKLTIAAREATWIAIRIDQQEAQQAYLRPGDTVTFSGTHFQMDIGNAGGIDMTLQGKPIPALGKSGQVVHVTLP